MKHMYLRCLADNCRMDEKEFSGMVPEYRVGLTALWFHSFHEGHLFEYIEDGVKILPPEQKAEGIHIKAECAKKKDCPNHPLEIDMYIKDYQIMLPLLELHAKHGNCGIHLND